MGLRWENFILAVDERGAMLGCGQIKPHRGGARELASIAVEPCCRGQGIARAIIERLMRSQPPPLYLTCRGSLEPLYEKFGFRALHSPEEMPPYFRRVSRLFRAFRRLIGAKESLLVMVWRG